MGTESDGQLVQQQVEENNANNDAAKSEIKEKANEENNEAETEGGAAMDVGQPPKNFWIKAREIEQDAISDTRPKISANAVAMSETDRTINVMTVFGGKLLTSFSDAGFSHLIACARSNVGMKAGRYLFEATIVEQNISSGKPLVRLGLTLQGSSLFLTDKNVFFFHPRICKGPRVGVLVNLDSSSANYHTISIFVDGLRHCMPQKLPEDWKGKTLFPTVNYRSVTLDLNFGPLVKAALPFACRAIGDAAEADVEFAEQVIPKGGKYEVLFPVCLPDHGAFDWADDFLAKNPSYTELSVRKIEEWALRSGLSGSRRNSFNDLPNMGFSLRGFDPFNIVRMAKTLADYYQGNLLILELRSNLLPEERMANLGKFSNYKKTALVLMGDPSEEYKKTIQDLILAEKIRKHHFERKRQAIQQKGKADKSSEKDRLVARKAQRNSVAAAASNDTEEGEESEPVAQERDEEAKQQEDKAAPVSTETEDPVVLTEEEKAIIVRPGQRDLNPDMVSKIFAKFALPSQEEGFDVIKYLWEDEEGSKKALHAYIGDLKSNILVEDIKPGEWFNKQWGELHLLTQQWRKKSNEWKNPISRKRILAKKLEDKKEAAKIDADGKAKAEVAEVKLTEVDFDEVDPYAVEDVTDVGSGEPLFSKWAAEDWILLTLRIQMHLLVHAFAKDVKDPGRPCFPASHTYFYYKKYFQQTLSIKSYGCKSFTDFVELLDESIKLSNENMLQSVLEIDTSPAYFVKLVEWHRRERQRAVEAGDEAADLKFDTLKGPGNFGSGPSMPPPQPAGASSVGVKRPSSASGFVPNKQGRLAEQNMAMAVAWQGGMMQEYAAWQMFEGMMQAGMMQGGMMQGGMMQGGMMQGGMMPGGMMQEHGDPRVFPERPPGML